MTKCFEMSSQSRYISQSMDGSVGCQSTWRTQTARVPGSSLKRETSNRSVKRSNVFATEPESERPRRVPFNIFGRCLVQYIHPNKRYPEHDARRSTHRRHRASGHTQSLLPRPGASGRSIRCPKARNISEESSDRRHGRHSIKIGLRTFLPRDT